jgi:hypothetical protein
MRVLPPNSPPPVAVAGYAPDPADDPRAGAEFSASSAPARHLQGMLSAGLFESVPLSCPNCGGDMRIMAPTSES